MSNLLERKINLWSLLKFTLPSIIMMVVMSLYTVVDGTFVSRLLNTDAFSAVNIVYPLISVTVGLGTMFGTGITAIVSRKLGEGKPLEARQNLTFIVISTIVLGFIISALCFLFLKDIIYLLGSNDEIYGYCYDYAFPLVFFIIANMLQLAFQSLYVANGKPHIGLVVTIIGGLSNVVLDYLFIAKLNMGISGAAIATGIGCAIPALYGLIYFTFNKKGNLYFVKPKTDWHVLKNTAINGSSEMVGNLSASITTFLFNIILMHFIGQTGVAAITILLYLDFVLVAIILGYSIGIAPLIGYNYGNGNKKNLKKIFRLSTGFCISIGVGMTVLTLLFSSQLASIFTAKGTDVYELAITGLGIYAFSYLFKGYSIFASGMFTAFGDGKRSAILAFMRTFVFLVAALLGFSAIFGLNGVWYATPVAEAVALGLSIFYTVRYRKMYHYM